jgi:hypothetical protein
VGTVRVEAGEGELHAYGYGDQKVRIPAADIGAVKVLHRKCGKGGPGLVVVDRLGRALLRARGAWKARADDGTGLRAVCEQLDLRFPEYLSGDQARQTAAALRRATEYRRLRTSPDGLATSRPLWRLLALMLGAACFAGGVLVPSALPGWMGIAADLIGLLLCTAAVWATPWFVALALRTRNWVRECLDRARPIPPGEFFAPNPRLGQVAGGCLTAFMPLLFIALVVYGPVVGLESLTDGFHDQALVSELRANGVPTTGTITGDTEFTTDSQGNIDDSYTVWLTYTPTDGQQQIVQDPAINGWTWPSQNENPISVNIVYLSSNPSVSAVAGQLVGSPWRGAPISNIIDGAVITVLLVPYTWIMVRRIARSSRAARARKADAPVLNDD